MAIFKSRAVRITQHGGPEQMQLVETEVGEPGPGEVRIRHHAIGLNFIDTYQRSGLYPMTMPLTLGGEEVLFRDLSGVAAPVEARAGKAAFREAARLRHVRVVGGEERWLQRVAPRCHRRRVVVGLHVAPYHANVPSFGEWGFVLASRRPWREPQAWPAGLRFITAPQCATCGVPFAFDIGAELDQFAAGARQQPASCRPRPLPHWQWSRRQPRHIRRPTLKSPSISPASSRPPPKRRWRKRQRPRASRSACCSWSTAIRPR